MKAAPAHTATAPTRIGVGGATTAFSRWSKSLSESLITPPARCFPRLFSLKPMMDVSTKQVLSEKTANR